MSKAASHIFFEFQLYINFKIWPLKLVDLEPWASMIYWSMTGKRSCNLLPWQEMLQKRKISCWRVHLLFRLISIFLATCQIIFDFLNKSMSHAEEALKGRCIMESMFLMITLLDRVNFLNEQWSFLRHFFPFWSFSLLLKWEIIYIIKHSYLMKAYSWEVLWIRHFVWYT